MELFRFHNTTLYRCSLHPTNIIIFKLTQIKSSFIKLNIKKPWSLYHESCRSIGFYESILVVYAEVTIFEITLNNRSRYAS